MTDPLTILGIVVFTTAMIALTVGVVVLQGRTQQRDITTGWTPLVERYGLTLETSHENGGLKAVAAGGYRDRPVKLQTFMHGTGDSWARYTGISLILRNPAQLALHLLSRRWYDSQGVGIGDPIFDKHYAIEASPQGAAATLLSDGDLRTALVNIPDVDLKLEGDKLRYLIPGMDDDPERLAALLDVMSRLADAVEGAAADE